MQRFFVPPETIQGNSAILDTDISRQLRTVLRAEPGTEITLLDNLGNAYLAIINECSTKRTVCSIETVWQPDTEPSTNIVLFQAIPKNQRMDIVIQKCTELGVCTIVPLLCERSVVRFANETSKHSRWRRIAKEAAEQSGRARIPIVGTPCSMTDALSGASDIQTIVPCLSDNAISLSNIVPGSDLRILIGPEGGFSPSEISLAEEQGAQLISLGKRVLRSETAGITASALLLYKRGDLE